MEVSASAWNLPLWSFSSLRCPVDLGSCDVDVLISATRRSLNHNIALNTKSPKWNHPFIASRGLVGFYSPSMHSGVGEEDTQNEDSLFPLWMNWIPTAQNSPLCCDDPRGSRSQQKEVCGSYCLKSAFVISKSDVLFKEKTDHLKVFSVAVKAAGNYPNLKRYSICFERGGVIRLA